MDRSSRTLGSSLLRTSAVLLALALAAAAAGQVPLHRVVGPDVPLFGGVTSSWALLDAAGAVVETGITLPLAAIETAPADHHRAAWAADVVVSFPEPVRETTFLDHLGVYWEPHGHFPEGRYGAPHWDLHLFTMPPAEAAAIDCGDLTQANPTKVPEGWLPPVPPGANASDFCVPGMGFHALPVSEFVAPGEFQPGQFDQVMLAGYYGGAFVFLEPMITQARLLRRESLTMPVPLPASLGAATRYPTTVELLYDASLDAYQLLFRDFVTID
jgi:hypothetical protein